jgi:hypothetical protein
MNNTTQIADLGEDKVCLNSFRKHWAEAQIDGPMQTVARFDDVSKLLITIGGFVLGTMATMLRERQDYPLLLVGGMFCLVALFFVFAVLVCYFQPKMIAKDILRVEDDAGLSRQIDDWCGDLQRVIARKRAFLYLTMVCFVASFLSILALLLRMY